MRAIRDNERRVRFFGTNVEAVKIGVFVLGAMLAALAGGVYATIVGFVSAPLFGFLFSTQILIWVAVGGRGTIIGPIIGAIGLSFVTSKLSASYPTEWALFLGLLFVAVVVFVPDGVVPPLVRAGPASPAPAPARRASAARSSRPRRRARSSGPRGEPVCVVSEVEFAYGALAGAARRRLRDQGGRAALHRRPERRRQVDDAERPHRRQAAGARARSRSSCTTARWCGRASRSTRSPAPASRGSSRSRTSSTASPSPRRSCSRRARGGSPRSGGAPGRSRSRARCSTSSRRPASRAARTRRRRRSRTA